MTPVRKGVAGVLVVGRYNYTSAQEALPDHAHGRAIEICFLVKGCQTYRLGDDYYRLNGGDVFLTLPGERHSTGGSPEEKGILYWMVLKVPSREEEFLGLPSAQARAMLRAFMEIPQRHFRGSWKMKEHLDALTSLYHQKEDPLRAFGMANQMGVFLYEVLTCSRQATQPGTTRLLAPVLRYIEQHLGEPLTVPQLAAQTGLSEARFKARFKQEIGVPPGEFVLRARIEEARRRLTKGQGNVTEIAYDMGFSTSQYFATVFRRFTGESPSSLLKKT